ncbi:GNAT family N-acetyltransferase [Streptomyces albipurpureus]|uniref:GNAT family N-acetyltransferase n=1 Tax=Streptomyces albipurpureus TaxID=2897419 RepID=A0ABT0UGJ4_9ACTN|nr:GNAT family N-acetyltransferase [Streptomyces sp. CWNU-1]MCM2387748.1 GNAT family N-acetyltransferase [Streptomyces sp. CWNU-1]
MDHDDLLRLFDRQLRREAPPDGPGTRVERVGDVVRQTGADSDWNGVIWSGLDRDTADAAIAEQTRHFTALGHSFEWKLYGHDEPGDLGDRLLRAGFLPEPTETLMVAPADALATEAVLPDGITLDEVTTPAGVDLMIDVNERAFATRSPWLKERLLGQLGQDTVTMTVAMADGRPISGARLEMRPGTKFAGLWGGGTLPEWRGRGVYRALVAHRARVAAARGARFLQVDASDQSRPILQRLGFAPLTTTTPYGYEMPSGPRSPARS